jgi:hypothetical protein
MVEHSDRLLAAVLALADDVRSRLERLDGLYVLRDELLHEEASQDLDLLQVLVDVSGLGINGCQVGDWLREHCRVDVGTADRLLDAMRRQDAAAPALPAAKTVALPDPAAFEVEPVLTPRETFFGPTRTVPASEAVGRVCAEQITPYPPGIPALLPGERISAELLDYLRTGLAAGMVLPDPADPTLDTIRVTRFLMDRRAKPFQTQAVPHARSAFDTGRRVRGADRLGLRRSTLPQIDRQDRHRRDGQQLRLPVLQGAVPEVRLEQVLRPRHRILQVSELPLVERRGAGDRLGQPRPEKQQTHHQAQRIRKHPSPYAAGPRPRRGALIGVRTNLLIVI